MQITSHGNVLQPKGNCDGIVNQRCFELKNASIFFDSKKERTMYVNYDSKVYKFEEHDEGLYHLKANKIITVYMHIQTVVEKETKVETEDDSKDQTIKGIQS